MSQLEINQQVIEALNNQKEVNKSLDSRYKSLSKLIALQYKMIEHLDQRITEVETNSSLDNLLKSGKAKVK